MKNITYLLLVMLLWGCESKRSGENENTGTHYKTVGRIERLSPELDKVISPDARIEVLADGFEWTEGPVWRKEEQKLIFTDVRAGKLYQWTEEEGVSLYLDVAEPDNRIGPSALLVDKNEVLHMLRYGHGQLVRMNTPISEPSMDFTIIAEGFNHTNDAAFHSNGDLYMSDPPPPGAQGPRQAVYRISPAGDVKMITDSLSSPNGIAFSPDESTIYIANADWQHAVWIAADVDVSGNISNGRTFFNATGRAPREKGHPDGLKVNRNGIIFATGPGGVYLLNSAGEHLGTILNDQFNTNCVLDDKEQTLYITSGPYLMRVSLK